MLIYQAMELRVFDYWLGEAWINDTKESIDALEDDILKEIKLSMLDEIRKIIVKWETAPLKDNDGKVINSISYKRRDNDVMNLIKEELIATD
jgi:hypothetical protein